MFKTTKFKVIFVVIFSIICIVVTTLMVLYKKIEILPDIEDNVEVTETKEKDVEGVNLKGTYNQNDIVIENKKVSTEKLDIKYFQINGLKNKTIQNQINQELEQDALNFYREEIQDLNSVKNVSVNMWAAGNFANTLSIELTYFAQLSDNSEDFYQNSKGFNYDLTTGEKITIDKLFTSDAPMEEILRKSAYYSLVTYNVEEDLHGYFRVKDYGEIEEELAEIIILYKRGKLTDFYYNPRAIYIKYGENNNYIIIEIEKWADYIAIYNRYLANENIYENNNIGLKNLYNVTERYIDPYYKIIYDKGSNYFIDITMICYFEIQDNSFEDNLLKEKIQAIQLEIDKIKSMANQNSNEFYILNYAIELSEYEDWITKEKYMDYSENGNTYKITIHDFEENIEPLIIEVNRVASNDASLPIYVYDFSEMLKVEPQLIKETYNPETGEKIVI